jgi:small-conductance mechanosensitive channel
MSLDLTSYIPLMSIVFSSMGISLVFKDYIADLIATTVIKRTKDIKVGSRIKIMESGKVTKGDIMETGILRTTIMEVGDGERLPSIRTGRLIKVPNHMLINNPVMIYGDTIIDEVVAFVPRPYPDSQLLLDSMKEAIMKSGHGLIDVGLYQKDNNLVIHGVFEVKTAEMADERSKILKHFLTSTNQTVPANMVAGANVVNADANADQVEIGKISLPLQNIERA